MIDELIDGLGFIAISKKGAEPGVADLNAADIKHRFQNSRIARVFTADFAAGKSGQRHFTDCLLESVLFAQIGHVVIGPADRCYRQLYILFVHLQIPESGRRDSRAAAK